MSTPLPAPPEPGLRAELRAVEAAHPAHHWHCWLSSAGRVWASSPHCEEAYGSGTTVDGSTPAQVDHEIAVTEHAWQAAA